MNHKNVARETQIAYKVRHALDRNLERLPESTTQRLAAARAMAVARKKNHVPETQTVRPLQLAGVAGQFDHTSAGAGGDGSRKGRGFGWLGRLSIAMPILLGIVLFVGLYRYEERNRIAELAEIDSAILSDELPIAAYLDHGFKAFLTTQER